MDVSFYPFLFGYAVRNGLSLRGLAVALLVIMARIIYVLGYCQETSSYGPAFRQGAQAR